MADPIPLPLLFQVGFTSAPGQGGILAQREFDRRFSPHFVSICQLGIAIAPRSTPPTHRVGLQFISVVQKGIAEQESGFHPGSEEQCRISAEGGRSEGLRRSCVRFVLTRNDFFQLDWAAFGVMTLPSIGIPLLLWYSSKRKYDTPKTKKN